MVLEFRNRKAAVRPAVLITFLAIVAVLVLPMTLGAQTSLFSDDFARSSIGPDWTIVDDPDPYGTSQWYLEGGKLIQYSNIYRSGSWETYYQGTHAVAGSPAWGDYSLQATVKPTDDDGWGMIIRYVDKENYYRFLTVQDPGNNGPFMRIDKVVKGTPQVLAERKDALPYNTAYQMKFEAMGPMLTVYVNGAKALEARDSSFAAGKVGFMTYACSIEVSKVLVVGTAPQAAPQAKVPSTPPAQASAGGAGSAGSYYTNLAKTLRFPLPTGWMVVDSDPGAGVETLSNPSDPSIFMVVDGAGIDTGGMDSKTTIEVMTGALKESFPQAMTATLLVGKKVAVRAAHFDASQGFMTWTYLIPHKDNAWQISIMMAADGVLQTQPDHIRRIMAGIEWAP